MTPTIKGIRTLLAARGWFSQSGVYVLVDGQFGSTGKGLVAGMLAETMGDKVGVVMSNAGPNSGHTSYLGEEKIVLRQLPTFGVVAHKLGHQPFMWLDNGAIIDPRVLRDELDRYGVEKYVKVSPVAAIADAEMRLAETGLTKNVGSTGKGTGAALARKVMRDPLGIMGHPSVRENFPVGYAPPSRMAFIEVSQGFSLGIDAGFFPYCTSRNCNVGQALLDAGVHPEMYRESMMVLRTFPIRVGGASGPGYPDQQEITWEDLGVEPERTTVTNKVRRVFTWSDIQFRHALAANQSRFLFLNFCNYVGEGAIDQFVRDKILKNYAEVMGGTPTLLLLGFGPTSEDVRVWR